MKGPPRDGFSVSLRCFILSCPNCAAITLSKPRDITPPDPPFYVVWLNPHRQLHEYSDGDVEQEIKAALDALGSRVNNGAGPKAGAIWLTDALGAYDPDWAREYCDALGLGYNSGPFIILSDVRPDRWQRQDQVTVVKLDGISPPRTIAILNIIEQDLVRIGETRPDGLLYKEIEQRNLTLFVERNVLAFLGFVIDLIK